MTQPDTIWYTRCPVPTTSGIAQHYGWLDDEFAPDGITLKSIRASEDKAVRVSHFDHSQPNMFREGGNVPPLWARGLGRNTALVGITWVDEEQLILVRGDSDIKTLDQLAGKRLGLPLHDSEIVDIGRSQDLRGLLTALRIAGLSRDDVTFVDLQGGDFDLRENRDGSRAHLGAQALLAGAADAIYAKGAVGATLVETHGFRPILDINAQTDPLARVNAGTPRPITVDATLARDHPEIVARYLAVLQQTAMWAKTHSDEVVTAIASETGAAETAVRRGFGPELHDHFGVALSPLYLQGLRQQKDFLVAEGFVINFDFDAWVNPGPLQLAGEITLKTVVDVAETRVPVAA